jgi:hypothetical protein
VLAVAIGIVILLQEPDSEFSGEFDLSDVTTYEPCLRAPGGCPCLRTGDCPRRLSEFQEFPIYWLGESFEGLPLTSVDVADYSDYEGQPTREVLVIYGSCVVRAGDEGCGIPLTIQISRFCESPVEAIRVAQAGDGVGLRGAKASAESPSSLRLRTGNVAIGIDGGAGSGGVRFVAVNLVRANGGEPSSPSESFEPPVDDCYAGSPAPSP